MSENTEQGVCPNKTCILQEPMSTAGMKVEPYVRPPCMLFQTGEEKRRTRTPSPDPEIPIKRPAPPPILPPCTTKAKENPCTGRLG
ncbi:hypothetical protein PoB_002971700 [Plakobranchus ocellatus]|uniref:Uncharacterized protein n=1 Tax=Plakobranchus ocellatus TaxID=259542 RepID=A0AAV4A8E8_9GAST|nr:hypothetical protein PoB_002971700 [Plakobranchus ocellatus]